MMRRLTKLLQINMAVPLHEPASSRYSVSVAASGYPSFTEEQLSAMRGGLTAEEYRWKLIKKVGERFTDEQHQHDAIES